ncbi:MAG: hypothetical protein AAFQ79_03115 [Pseudomonadota bacterium]
MGQLEAINLLKRISVVKTSAATETAQQRDRSIKRPLPKLSSDYLDTMFDRSERVIAKQPPVTT